MATKKRAPKSSPGMIGMDESWRARDALSTLTRAQEIQSDKKLMAQVQKEAARQQSAIAKATGAKAQTKPTPRKR